ncbi:MAG TPA: 7-cyano-7-deazaguanine synthase [Tepidisphaeraceae bacterium]|jgi:7-cyano-7-deazaguanine synthase
MAKDLAIVLVSGSVNSAVAAAVAAQKYRPVFVYGETVKADQPTRQRLAYDALVAHFRPFRDHPVAMQLLAIQSDKLLAANADARAGGAVAASLAEAAALIGAAVPVAMAYDAAAIYLGLRVGAAHAELSAATEFLQIWTEMLQMPLGRTEMELSAPLLELEPWQVVDLGVQVSAPLDKTWSCHESHADACGSCRGCRAREAAFMQAAKIDPAKKKA